jgi:hypothetical protein
MTYSYSINEENFRGDFETAEQAAAEAFKNNPDYDTVWVGVNIHHKAHDFIYPDELLEIIAEKAYENQLGDDNPWLYMLIKNKEKCAEFKKLIGDWLELNEPVNFWEVDNIEVVERGDYR